MIASAVVSANVVVDKMIKRKAKKIFIGKPLFELLKIFYSFGRECNAFKFEHFIRFFIRCKIKSSAVPWRVIIGF